MRGREVGDAARRNAIARSSDGRTRVRRSLAWAWLAGTALCSALIAASGALAQEPTAAPGSILLDTIDVFGRGGASAIGPVDGYVATQSATGTKTSTPLIETPQSISVVGRDQIDAQKAQTVTQATRYSAGIRSETFGFDTRNYWYLLRGFSAQETGYYKDGLQLFQSGFANWGSEAFGLERIEVLRGPSAVLYGAGPPGGIVNLISKRPPFEPLRYLESGIDNYGNRYLGIDVGGPANKDGTLFMRMTGFGRGGGTQVDFTQDDHYFVAPALTWKPSEATTFTILSSIQRDSVSSLNFLPYVGTVVPAPFGRIPTSLFTGEPAIDKFVRDTAMIGYQFEHHFNDTFTVRQNLRFNHLRVDYLGPYAGGYASPPTATQALLTRFNFGSAPKVNLFTVDNQAEARFATGPLQHTLLFGLDYKRYSLDDIQGFDLGPSIDILRPVYGQSFPPPTPYLNNQQVLGQVGLYLQDQIKLNERLILVLSGRNDWADARTDDFLALKTSRQDDRAFSGRAGLVYLTDVGLAPYLSYSTSFNPIVGTDFFGAPFKPETGEQYEAGVKYQPPGFKSSITASVFDLTRQNVLTADPDNPLNSVQAGEVRSRGVEVEAIASLAEGLDLIGAFTAYDLKVTESNGPDLGKVLTATPETFASLWLDYTIQTGPLKGLGAGGGVRYVGSSFADTLNTFKVPDVTVFDAVVHYDHGNFRLALNAFNLFDETFVASCSSTDACYYGPRRKVILSASYKW